MFAHPCNGIPPTLGGGCAATSCCHHRRWRSGLRIFAAGLDTYDPEPPQANNPLFALPNIVLTPHAAGPTWESWPKRFGNSYDNVERVARGEKPLWVVPELR